MRIGVAGAGATALWLAREASALGIECHVFGEVPQAGWASTKNQGWLQTGALYAAKGQTQAAIDCLAGSNDLRLYAPEGIRSEYPCYYFFEQHQQALDFLSSCDSIGIPAIEVHIGDVWRHVPATRGSLYQFAAQVRDCPIDTHVILTKVAWEAEALGARFIHADLSTLSIKRTRGGWTVGAGGRRGTYDSVVLAAGPLMRDLVAHQFAVLGAPGPDFQVSQIEVVTYLNKDQNALAEPLAMLVTPHLAHGPMVVPFDLRNTGGARRVGFTVCLNQADQLTNDPLPWSHRSKVQKETEQRMDFHYPSWQAGVGVSQIHVCQKTYLSQHDQSDRSRIVLALGDHSAGGLDGLFAVYPGKLTTSRIAARDCLGRIVFRASQPVKKQPYR